MSANIPEGYIRSPEQRMDIYRRIALIRTEAEADDLTDEIIDRFGDPPPSVNALIHVALLRGEAGKAGISDIQQKDFCASRWKISIWKRCPACMHDPSIRVS